MDVRLFVFVVCCVGSGLCDKLITRSEESYRVCVCVAVCDLETTTMRRSRPELSCCANKKNRDYFLSSGGTSIFTTVQTSLGFHLVLLPMLVRSPLGLNICFWHEWSGSRSGLFTPENRLCGSHRVGGWVGQRVSLDALEKERDLSCAGIEPGFVGRAARSIVSVVTELCCRVMCDFGKDCCRNAASHCRRIL
jgi:hypothetical protein